MLIGVPNKIVVADSPDTLAIGKGVITGVLVVTNKTADVSVLIQNKDGSGIELGNFLVVGTEDSRYFGPLAIPFTDGLYTTIVGAVSIIYIYTRKGLATN